MQGKGVEGALIDDQIERLLGANVDLDVPESLPEDVGLEAGKELVVHAARATA